MAGTQNQPTEYEQISYNVSTGSQWCNTSTGKIGFFGTTPVAKYTLVGAASTYLTTTLTTSTSGFTTLVDFTSFMYQVSTITQALKGYGLV